MKYLGVLLNASLKDDLIMIFRDKWNRCRLLCSKQVWGSGVGRRGAGVQTHPKSFDMVKIQAKSLFHSHPRPVQSSSLAEVCLQFLPEPEEDHALHPLTYVFLLLVQCWRRVHIIFMRGICYQRKSKWTSRFLLVLINISSATRNSDYCFSVVCNLVSIAPRVFKLFSVSFTKALLI